MPPPTLSPLQTSPFCSSSVSQWSVNEIDPHRFHAVDSSFYSSYSPRSPYISGARSLYSELWPVVPVFGQKRLLCSLKASIFAYTRAWAQCRMRSSRRKKKETRNGASTVTPESIWIHERFWLAASSIGPPTTSVPRRRNAELVTSYHRIERSRSSNSEQCNKIKFQSSNA